MVRSTKSVKKKYLSKNGCTKNIIGQFGFATSGVFVLAFLALESAPMIDCGKSETDQMILV